MTTFNKATLKTFFQTNDVPDGNDYANFIDSYVNIVDTGAQSIASQLTAPEFSSSRISAGNGNFTGTLTIAGQVSADSNFKAKSISVSALQITNNVSANKGYFNSDVSVSGNVATSTLTISGQTSANDVNINGEFVRPVVNYIAAGTAQAAATVVSAGNSFLTGASDGQATGYRLMSNKTGLVQFVYNQNTVSANLYPCVGGQINVLASNAAFGMAASTLYTVLHVRSSGYAVK